MSDLNAVPEDPEIDSKILATQSSDQRTQRTKAIKIEPIEEPDAD